MLTEAGSPVKLAQLVNECQAPKRELNQVLYQMLKELKVSLTAPATWRLGGTGPGDEGPAELALSSLGNCHPGEVGLTRQGPSWQWTSTDLSLGSNLSSATWKLTGFISVPWFLFLVDGADSRAAWQGLLRGGPASGSAQPCTQKVLSGTLTIIIENHHDGNSNDTMVLITEHTQSHQPPFSSFTAYSQKELPFIMHLRLAGHCFGVHPALTQPQEAKEVEPRRSKSAGSRSGQGTGRT